MSVIIENCTPYDVTIERNDIMGLIEMENDKIYPLTDETAAGICAIINSNIPNTPRTQLTKEDIARPCNLHVLDQFRNAAAAAVVITWKKAARQMARLL